MDEQPGTETPDRPARTSWWRRGAGLATLWVAVAVGAIVVGLLAVAAVGANLRDRGPVGAAAPTATTTSPTTETPASEEPTAETPTVSGTATSSTSLDPAADRIGKVVSGDFGEFEVACQGYYALGVAARPDEAAGWRVVEYDRGPDDDVDATFARAGESVEVEVYCLRGEPTVADLERKTRPDGDDDD